ncbi:MAG: hypothetical protein V9H69_10105 [Anaerolineae bacterium]
MGWRDALEVEFRLSHGDRIRLLRRSGFAMEELMKLRRPETATGHLLVALEWPGQWSWEGVGKAGQRA